MSEIKQYKWNHKHDLTKRFWLFEIPCYYASGGFNDISITLDNLNDLKTTIYGFDNYEDDEIIIFDSHTKKTTSVGLYLGCTKEYDQVLKNIYCGSEICQNEEECFDALKKFFGVETSTQ